MKKIFSMLLLALVTCSLIAQDIVIPEGELWVEETFGFSSFASSGGDFSFAGTFASGGWYPTIGGLEVSKDVFYEAIQYVDPRVYQAWDAEKLRDQNNLTAVALTSGISGGIAIIGTTFNGYQC